MIKNNTKYKETEIGAVPREWNVVITDDLLVNQKGSLKIGPFGSQLKKEYMVKDGYKVYGQENIYKNNFELGDRFINDERFKVLNSCELLPDDFIISMMGTIGFVSIVPRNIKKGIIDSHLLRLRIDQNKYDSKFIFYAFKSNKIQTQIESLSVGTIMAGLSSKVIRMLKFPAPPIDEQTRIAEILSSLDDKIELNRKINDNLEKLATALFKKWFVDIGDELPDGWKITELKNILELNYGKALKAEDRKDGQVKVYGSSGFIGFHNTKLVDGPGIIVGRKGNVGSVFWSDSDFYTIDTTYFVKSKLPLTFCYYLLKNQTFINGDSVVPGLNRDQAYRIEVKIPSIDLIKKFDTIAIDLRKTIASIERETEMLSSVRDSLLPRLMNGKIRVKT